MNEIKIFNPKNTPTQEEKNDFIEFLYEHLEQYGDSRAAIGNCIDFALKEIPSFGGFMLVNYSGNEILGMTVLNRTGMKDYIPENILVYISTHKDHRGKGIGKQLMEKTIELADGSIALHVEADNPAKFLYEKYGFTNPYLEMRLKK